MKQHRGGHGKLPPGDIYYLIRSKTYPRLVWSAMGWTTQTDRALRFTNAAHNVMVLPVDGVWSFRRDTSALIDRGFVRRRGAQRVAA